ncbi:MAG: MFS transporter [Bacteroidota bacterium]
MRKIPHLQTLIFLFAANIVSGFSQGVTMLAIPWYLVQAPDGKFQNAMMVSIVTLASLFWGIYAGTLIDKYNRKRIFQTVTGVDAGVLLTVASVGIYLGYMPFPLVVLVFTATIFTYNVHYPNLYAFVQELFDKSYYAKVNSALEIQGQTTNFIGMMLAGLLLGGTPEWSWWPEAWTITPWKLQEIFLLDGSTYILGFILISLIPYSAKTRGKIDKGSMVQRIVQGFYYLGKRREILIFGIASYVVFFSLLIMVQVAAPVYVNDYLKEKAIVLSSFKGIYALGAITAGLLGLAAFIRKDRPVQLIIFLEVLAVATYLLLAGMQSVAVLLMSAYILGISNAGVRILRITYLVRIVPNRVIGRVNSFFNVINVLMRVSFSALLAIPFFSQSGNGGNIIYAMYMMAGIIAVAAILLYIMRDRFPQEPEEDETPLPEVPPAVPVKA